MSTAQNSGISPKTIARLNAQYQELSVKEKINQLYQDFDAEDVMLTSSFAATSAFLLRLFSWERPQQKIFFIDTGYHFPETLAYKEHLTKLYGLNVVSIRAEQSLHDFTLKDKTWSKNPEFCCSINKVEPLNHIKGDYKVWVSGLMRWQSDHRATLDIFEERGGILKFYPLLNVTREEKDQFIKENELPFHPLVAQGYMSIGCHHCTVPGEDRTGRWNNSPKTECGLHL
ncbi:MAG: phosphoadenylyl-sulfate reductase [Saprospiraceae bacterium]|nr:phosphoadenylyl-sulfate reductase [Saprospiraceae bacterium]